MNLKQGRQHMTNNHKPDDLDDLPPPTPTSDVIITFVIGALIILVGLIWW